ncbi:hypothetical protein OSTOST_10272, partial [Ostertagia ostertagi]
MYYENLCIPAAEDVVSALYGWGFGMKRQAISSSLKYKEVTLSNIPDELARLRDGRLCVHEQNTQLHIYYSEGTVEMACTPLWPTACTRNSRNSSHSSIAFTEFAMAEWNVLLLYSLTARKTEEVQALWRPPVPEGHVAYEKCKEYLRFLHATWFDVPLVPYEDIRLNISIGMDHPSMRVLIENLKYIDFEAKCTLRWINE